ncbi:MAG: Glucokinase [Alphaproteobacteria bacterium MarineAlpha5_Bin7]|nr:MAG: Glucokinase [Alphaproteobacteria bacterium MarineAlpha5_Bin7]|tara:strand:+ start:188 stop:1090 length:903 start_codon:yes stop_codon:yes gene_type:complete
MTKYSLGIDVGGTKTSIGIIDLNKGKVIKKIEIKSKTFKNDKKNLLNITKNALKIIRIAQREYSIKINKIGIGVPELINNDGIIKGAFNFKWENLSFKKHFQDFKIKAKADSDVRNALRGEKLYGAGKKYKNLIFVNIGTGLSYALYQNKKIYSGYNGFAIHFASSEINLFNPIKNKNFNLVPEDYYSGKSITKKLFKIINKKNIDDFGRINKLNLKQKKYLEDIAKSLGSLIALLVNILDPQCVILGGGVALNNKFLNKMMIKYTRKYIFAKSCKKIPIINSKLKNDAALLGAAAIFSN